MTAELARAARTFGPGGGSVSDEQATPSHGLVPCVPANAIDRITDIDVELWFG